jgi:hypothetical protein
MSSTPSDYAPRSNTVYQTLGNYEVYKCQSSCMCPLQGEEPRTGFDQAMNAMYVEGKNVVAPPVMNVIPGWTRG